MDSKRGMRGHRGVFKIGRMGRTDGRTKGRTDGRQTDGRTDGQTDGQKDRQTRGERRRCTTLFFSNVKAQIENIDFSVEPE